MLSGHGDPSVIPALWRLKQDHYKIKARDPVSKKKFLNTGTLHNLEKIVVEVPILWSRSALLEQWKVIPSML
jgi:hypothetical protein